jgi:hypothetical protein
MQIVGKDALQQRPVNCTDRDGILEEQALMQAAAETGPANG